jgi:hypothetical protein
MDHSAAHSRQLGQGYPAHQRRVDEMIAAVRNDSNSDRPSLFKPPPPKPEPSSRVLDHRIAEELEYLSRLLDQLGAVLSDDPILLMRHMGPMQSIDLMKQTLGQLARVIAAEDKEEVADRITLTELKGRLQRKALRLAGGGTPLARQ